MTSQQLLPILVIAVVVNVAIILIALVSTRSTGSRARAMRPQEAAAGVAGVDGAGIAAADGGTATAESTPPPPVETSEVPWNMDVTDETLHAQADAVAAALTDPGTGLESAGAWRRAIGDELTRLARYHRPATVVLLELDGYERLVGRLGEAAGARIVLATAQTLRAEARASDRVARIGRGRFAALLPETDDIKAINFVDRVRSACDHWLEAGEVALRLAIGWAVLDPNEGSAAAIDEAERRLDAERRHHAGSGAAGARDHAAGRSG